MVTKQELVYKNTKGHLSKVSVKRRECDMINERQVFVEAWQVYYEGASEQVLGFIYDFRTHSGGIFNKPEEAEEIIRNQFRNGYCYYFAHMLKLAFGRGEVCIAAPIGHFVWMDVNGMPYDIEGVNESDCEEYIPESFLGDMVQDFLHVKGVTHNTTKEEIEDLIKRYKATH